MKTANWRKDLREARKVDPRQKDGYELVLNWYEEWRLEKRLNIGCELANAYSRSDESCRHSDTSSQEKRLHTGALRGGYAYHASNRKL